MNKPESLNPPQRKKAKRSKNSKTKAQPGAPMAMGHAAISINGSTFEGSCGKTLTFGGEMVTGDRTGAALLEHAYPDLTMGDLYDPSRLRTGMSHTMSGLEFLDSAVASDMEGNVVVSSSHYRHPYAHHYNPGFSGDFDHMQEVTQPMFEWEVYNDGAHPANADFVPTGFESTGEVGSFPLPYSSVPQAFGTFASAGHPEMFQRVGHSSSVMSEPCRSGEINFFGVLDSGHVVRGQSCSSELGAAADMTAMRPMMTDKTCTVKEEDKGKTTYNGGEQQRVKVEAPRNFEFEIGNFKTDESSNMQPFAQTGTEAHQRPMPSPSSFFA